MKPFPANRTLQPLFNLIILLQTMAACVVINFIFCVTGSKTVPLLEMVFLIVGQLKKLVTWDAIGGVYPENFVCSNDVWYESGFTHVMWILRGLSFGE